MTACTAPPVATCPSRRGDVSWAAGRGVPDVPRPGRRREAAAVVRHSDVADPQLPLHDGIQQRYELIRPLVLLQEQTARPRAQETNVHPETVGALKRRFEAQGMLGLLPETLQVIPLGRRRRVPDEVVEELQRLKGLYDGFGYRELARILFHTCARRVSHHSVKKL